ncbi:unnamed protein product [Peniophora sp. CBMAI 1063]|nr:unnamed protein product [Peniophora sp. CBMAI 1063]
MSSDPGNKDHVETMDIDLSLILAHESLSKLAHCVTGARALTLAHDGHGLAEREYVTQFTLLRHLTLSGVTLASITSLLEPQSDSSSGLLFPSLQSISIGGCVVWDLISTSPQSPGTGVLRLRRALQSRAGRGYPVNPVLVHIKEELEFIQREDWERTSCSKYLHNVGTIVRERLEDLHAIEGLRIVPYKSAYILDDDGQTGRLVEWFV